MPVTSYTITSEGLQVSGKPLQTGEANLRNTGTATIYVSDVQTLGTNTGYPLPPGSQLTWTAEMQALYAWCPTSSTLVISDNAGAGFDSGGIAEQLIAQGLAQDIANQISLAGVPAIDRPDILIQDTGRVIAASTSYTFATVDVSRYASVLFNYAEAGASGAGTQVRFITLNWYSDAGGTIYLGSDSFLPSVDGGIAVGQLPARGAFLQVVYNAVATAVSSIIDLTLAGSFRNVADVHIRCSSQLTNTVTVVRNGSADGLSIAAANAVAVGTYDWYPYSWAGPVRINVQVNAVTTAGGVDLIDLSSGALITRVTLPVSASSQNYVGEAFVPPMQYRVKLTNNSAALNYVITLQQQGAA